MLSLFFPVGVVLTGKSQWLQFYSSLKLKQIRKKYIVSVNVWKPIQINQIESHGKESVLVSDDCGQK